MFDEWNALRGTRAVVSAAWRAQVSRCRLDLLPSSPRAVGHFVGATDILEVEGGSTGAVSFHGGMTFGT